jgi:hypothetical protein
MTEAKKLAALLAAGAEARRQAHDEEMRMQVYALCRAESGHDAYIEELAEVSAEDWDSIRR